MPLSSYTPLYLCFRANLQAILAPAERPAPLSRSGPRDWGYFARGEPSGLGGSGAALAAGWGGPGGLGGGVPGAPGGPGRGGRGGSRGVQSAKNTICQGGAGKLDFCVMTRRRGRALLGSRGGPRAVLGGVGGVPGGPGGVQGAPGGSEGPGGGRPGGQGAQSAWFGGGRRGAP